MIHAERRAREPSRRQQLHTPVRPELDLLLAEPVECRGGQWAGANRVGHQDRTCPGPSPARTILANGGRQVDAVYDHSRVQAVVGQLVKRCSCRGARAGNGRRFPDECSLLLPRRQRSLICDAVAPVCPIETTTPERTMCSITRGASSLLRAERDKPHGAVRKRPGAFRTPQRKAGGHGLSCVGSPRAVVRGDPWTLDVESEHRVAVRQGCVGALARLRSDPVMSSCEPVITVWIHASHSRGPLRLDRSALFLRPARQGRCSQCPQNPFTCRSIHPGETTKLSVRSSAGLDVLNPTVPELDPGPLAPVSGWTPETADGGDCHRVVGSSGPASRRTGCTLPILCGGRPTGTSSGDRRAVESRATRDRGLASDVRHDNSGRQKTGDPGESRGRACAAAIGVSLRAAPPSHCTGTRRTSPRSVSQSLRAASRRTWVPGAGQGTGGPCVAPKPHAKSA